MGMVAGLAPLPMGVLSGSGAESVSWSWRSAGAAVAVRRRALGDETYTLGPPAGRGGGLFWRLPLRRGAAVKRRPAGPGSSSACRADRSCDHARSPGTASVLDASASRTPCPRPSAGATIRGMHGPTTPPLTLTMLTRQPRRHTPRARSLIPQVDAAGITAGRSWGDAGGATGVLSALMSAAERWRIVR